MNTIKETLKQSYEIENWKFTNCYDETRIDCRTCCSGGSMLGAMCEKMIDKEGESKSNT